MAEIPLDDDEDQELALGCLRRYGQWPSGWNLGDNERAERALKALAARGLVKTSETPPQGLRPGHTKYTPVERS